MDEIVRQSIIQNNFEDVMRESMIPYAEHVILDRALPRVEDGLKPVQRRILYSMFDLGITPDKPYKKCAKVVGDCLAKYHPHGDTSVYDALVRLAQPFNMRRCLVDGHGNFGSVDGDTAAAMRYTEARLQPLACEMLADIDKDTVHWSLNFDDSLEEPDTLPGKFPNLLVNGAKGIAVGLKTDIPTHNLGEVIDGAIAYIDNPSITLEEMMKIIPAPDFSTGGYIIAGEELKEAYRTGKGKILLRARMNFEKDGDKRNIVITEFPFQENKANILSKIADLMEKDKEGPMSYVQDVRDESDRNGIRAIIKLKKGSDENAVLEYILKNTTLQTTCPINFIAIADGKPKQLGLLDYFNYYTKYQINVLCRRTKYDLDKAKEKAHIIEGLIIAVNNIDEVVQIIKTSEDTSHAKQNLIKRFDLSERQAQAILDLKLSRITKLEVFSLQDELRALNELISKLQAVLDSKKLQKDEVKKEMLAIKKKYKDDRRSEIVYSADDIKMEGKSDKPFIENVVVGVNGNNVIRKVKAVTYKKTSQNETPVLAEIFRMVIPTTSDKKLYMFTNRGNCYKYDIFDLPEAKGAMSGGIKLNDLVLDSEKGEQIVSLFAIDGENAPQNNLCFITKGGMVKVTNWSEYVNFTKSNMQAIKLKEKDEVLSVFDFDENKNLFMVTECGKYIYVRCNDVAVQGRISMGVKGASLLEGDKLVFGKQVTDITFYDVVVATNFGTFKKVMISSDKLYDRGAKGNKICDVSDGKKSKVIYANVVEDDKILKLAVLDSENNMLYTDSMQISYEDATSKGKPVVNLGIITPKEIFTL